MKKQKLILLAFIVPVIITVLTACSTAHVANKSLPTHSITCTNDTIFNK